jgi:hypothetical protein
MDRQKRIQRSQVVEQELLGGYKIERGHPARQRLGVERGG